MAIEEEQINANGVNAQQTIHAIPTLDHNHPLFLQPTDTPGSSLISLQLTGSDNYALWSRSMRIGLLGKSKLGKVWEDLKERFNKVNRSRVLFLHREIHTLTQGTVTIANYFSKLRDLWDEFDAIMPCPGCPCPESQSYLQHFEYQRLLQFLMGPNESYP
ncbi:hypothetical protein KY290_024492 [Solanum tuberosum]|uniref:Retrotransposon Copia-like N-terminal domain-containing protein n=1 Tax=Solanum tuberosum TaxID=4113 RepID=A0ABQ7USU9_SOLTU|nr:hypothetical protein KY285_023243 [Solanum tuberosum]KAH0754222.1 hypothetical protein KY290_024492 [Solanum tuberosum]